MKNIAEFVKERRKEVGLTQEEFAERTGRDRYCNAFLIGIQYITM